MKRQMQMDHLKEFIGRGGTFANVSIQRKMKEDQLAKLQLEADADADGMAALLEDEELSLNIMAGGVLAQPPIQLRDVGFGYPGMAKPLFRHAELGVSGGSRVVLLGENGNGKTTLVKLMMGELEPTEGEVRRDPGARVALVNQHHADQLDLDQSGLNFMRSHFPGDGR